MRSSASTVYQVIGWSFAIVGYTAYLIVRVMLAQRRKREETVARLIAADARGKVGEWQRHEHMLPREGAVNDGG